MKVQRTMIGINSKPSQQVLLKLLCFVGLALCFKVANGLQQRRIISESILSSSIRGGQNRHLGFFGDVCNICPNSVITSPETLIPGQSITCSTLDSMGQNKTFRSSKCKELQTDIEVASLCCGQMTTTVTPTTSPSSSESPPLTSPSPTSKSPPVASPTTTTTTKQPSPPPTTAAIISVSEEKQGISTGGAIVIVIIIVLLVSAIGYYYKHVKNKNFQQNDYTESDTQANSDQQDKTATIGFLSFRTRFHQQKRQKKENHHPDNRNDNDDMDIDIDIDLDNDMDNDNRIYRLAAASTDTNCTSCKRDIEKPTGVVEKTIILPCGVLGLVLETGKQVRQLSIDEISIDSPLKDYVTVGDIIISINGTDTRFMNSQEVAKLLKSTSTISDRTMVVLSSNNT